MLSLRCPLGWATAGSLVSPAWLLCGCRFEFLFPHYSVLVRVHPPVKNPYRFEDPALLWLCGVLALVACQAAMLRYGLPLATTVFT